MPSKKAKATPAPATVQQQQEPGIAAAPETDAAASAQPGQEPELPPPPPDSDQPIPEQDQAPQPAALGVDLAAGNAPIAPIHELADARALPDVTGGVHQAPVYIIDSPLAIRAFKDHDGRSMAVVWTGTTLAKAAITD